MKYINVAKYNASGNDFLIFHSFLHHDYSPLAKRLCNRIEGIGADGLVVLLPSLDKDLDFVWDFYNSDGSLASMCGNASRAVAHYSNLHSLSTTSNIKFGTKAGVIKANIDGEVIESAMVEHREEKSPFEENGFLWWLVDTGVPHLVTICDDLDKFDLSLAKQLRDKYNANVNFLKIKDGDIYIRTYEKGVENETLACGTGMCAGFLWAMKQGEVKDSVRVYPKSNTLISLRFDGKCVYLKGKVEYIFSSRVSIGEFL